MVSPKEADRNGGPTVTELAQAHRRNIILFTQQGVQKRERLTSAQARQAYALAEEMTEAMEINQMGLIIVPESRGMFEVGVYRRRAGEVDLSDVIGIKDRQVRILSDWYKALYTAVQANNLRQAYLIFENTLEPLGVTSEGDVEAADMFMEYDCAHPVRQQLEIAQNSAQSILKNTIIREGTRPELSFVAATSMTFNLWNLIGELNPQAHDDIRNGNYPIESLTAHMGTENILDAHS